MSTRHFDVAICGAGIGGACAAIALAKRGARVLLLESGTFPRHKVCGEFLSPESRAVFSRLGALDEILKSGANEISRVQLVTQCSRALSAPLPAKALGISRWALDEILWKTAARAGVLCLSQARVAKIERAGESPNDGFAVIATNAIYRAHAAVDATGRARLSLHQGHKTQSSQKPKSQNSGARFFGLKAHFRGVDLEDDLVELHFRRGGYCGLARVENGLSNVCLLARYDAENNAPQAVWSRVLAASPALNQRMKNATQVLDWMATGNVQFVARAPVDENGILRAGDAGGYIHPLAGDGMAMAARSGELAAAVLSAQLRGSLSTHDAAQLYGRAWRREFSSRLKCADILGEIAMSRLSPHLIKFLGAASIVEQRFGSGLIRATRGAV